jgi:hypothetical protein
MDKNILAIHDRIDEEHFEVRLLSQAVRALQEKVSLLQAEVRELRRENLAEEEDGNELQPTKLHLARAPRSRASRKATP